MAPPVISISSDSSEESVGSHAPRVILFGVIPAIIPVIPEVPIVLADPLAALICFKSFKFIMTENTNFIIGKHT
ncbi:hypothetical protein Tco_0608694, partial [Tanacetum coccineum]